MTTNTELIARLRSFETDHKPDGWPAIQMRDVSALLDAIEALEAQAETLRYEFDAVAAIKAERDALQAQLAAAQGQDWSEFDKWYWKATESSQPRDWMKAALAAQQVRNAAPVQQPAEPAQGVPEGMRLDMLRTVKALQAEEDAGWSQDARKHLRRLATSIGMLATPIPQPAEPAQPEPFTPDWSQDSAAADSIREHQAICNLLLKEMRYIAGISAGQVKRVAEQALEAVKQAQPERTPTVSVQWLAEMIMSDCGCSTNNQILLDRIINRIDQHERANTTQQAQPERAPLSLQEIADAWGLKPENIPASDIEAVREIEAAIKQGGQQ